MAGTLVFDPGTLCPDGRLIPTGSGAYFHPYGMDVPIDLVAFAHAMQAPREAGPAIFLSRDALADPDALAAVRRVIDDLPADQTARIATVPGEPDALTLWLDAADSVGVPVSVPYRPWMEPSARVVRVNEEGRPAADGAFARVLPRGLAATLTRWQPVGRADAVDLLRTQFPELSGLNADRDPAADAGWLTNCVISSIAAVSQMLDRGQAFRAVPMVVSDVSILTAVVDGGTMLDTDRMATIAAALPVPGATGLVVVDAERGQPGHVFVARRVTAIADPSDPMDGVAFYDAQTDARAAAPLRPSRLRFVGIPGTGVDVTPIEAAPRRTPAAVRDSRPVDPGAADVAGMRDPEQYARLAGFAAQALAPVAGPVPAPPAQVVPPAGATSARLMQLAEAAAARGSALETQAARAVEETAAALTALTDHQRLITAAQDANDRLRTATEAHQALLQRLPENLQELRDQVAAPDRANRRLVDLRQDLAAAHTAWQNALQQFGASQGPEPDKSEINRINGEIETVVGETSLREFKAKNARTRLALFTELEAAAALAEAELRAAQQAYENHPLPAELETVLDGLLGRLTAAREAERELTDQHAVAVAEDAAFRPPEDRDLTRFDGSAHSYLGVRTEVLIESDDADHVRDLVRRHVEAVADAEHRDALREEVDRMTTQIALVGDLAGAIGTSGSTRVIGTGAHALRVTLWATMTRDNQPDVLPDHPTSPMIQAESLKYHASSNVSGQQSSNFRDVPVTLPWFVPLTKGPFRVLNVGGTARYTAGRSTRTTAVDLGMGQGTLERMRGSGHAHSYTVGWRASVEPAADLPTVRAAPADDPVRTPVVVHFPDHIAVPRPPADPTALPNAEQLSQAMMSLDSLHDPGSVGPEILRRLPGLAGNDGLRLDPDSQREVLEFSGFGNTHSSLLRLRREGLLSNPLRDVDGNEIGVLRLKAVPTEGVGSRIVTQSTYNTMGIYHQVKMQERGTARSRYGLEFGGNLGATKIWKPIEQTTAAGTYGWMGFSFGGAIGRAVVQGTNTGTSSDLGRGLRAGRDTDDTWDGRVKRGMVADLDIHYTLELLTPGDSSKRDEWDGRAINRAGARVRYLRYTPTGASTALHPPAGVVDGDAPGMVVYQNLTLSAPTRAPDPDDPSFRMPGSFFRPGPPVNDEERGAAAVGVDDWVRQKLMAEGYLARDGAGDETQAINFRRFLDTSTSFYREAYADELRGTGLWVPYGKQGTDQVWVHYTARQVAGAPPVHGGSTPELRMNVSVDTFMRRETVRQHVTSKRGTADLSGNVPLVKAPAIPEGLKPEDVPEFLEKNIPPHVLNTASISGTPIGVAAEDTVSSISGQARARSVILSSSAGQPVHKFTVTMDLNAEIYRAGADTPFARYRVGDGPGQTATVEAWIPDMRVLDQPQVRAPLALRAFEDIDRIGLASGPTLPNLSGVSGVRGSARLNSEFHRLTHGIYGTRFFPGLFGNSPGSEATMSAQARRVFLSEARLIAVIDQVMRGSHVTEQPLEPGAVSDVEGRNELQGYVSGLPRLLPVRDGANRDTYVEDGTQLHEGHELGHQHDVNRTSSGGGGLSGAHGAGGGQARVSRGRGEGDSRTALGGDYRVNDYELPVYSIAVPVTFVGTATFGARNPVLSAASAVGRDPAESRRFALDVPDAIEALVSINDLATIWHELERTWPAGDQRPLQVGDRDDQGRPVRTFIRNLPADLRQAIIDAKNTLFPVPGAAPPAGTEVRYLPRRISARQGLGDTSVLDVRLNDPARALFDDAVAAVTRELPGVLTPGSATYTAGFYEAISTLTSSIGTRTGVRRFFSAGDTDAPVRLGRVSQVVDTGYGQVVAEVETIARPAARYRGAPATAHPTELYGTPVDGADLEAYHLSGTHRQRSQGQSRSNLDGVLTATAHPRPKPDKKLRLTGGTGSVEARRQHQRGFTQRDQQVNRPAVKSAGNVARATVPMEVAVRVTVTPMKEWLPSVALPISFAGVSAAWTAATGRAAPAPAPRWRPANVTLEFLREDGTRQRLAPQPPAEQDRLPTLFRQTPVRAAATVLPTTAPPEAFTRAPDDEQMVRAAGGRTHFRADEIGRWQPFDGLNERFRVNRFSAAHELADAAAAVLPTAYLPDLQDFLDSEVGGGNAYALTSRGGVRHTLLNHTWGLAHELTLDIKPVRASPWRVLSDRVLDEHGRAVPFTPTELAPAVMEYFPIYASGTTASASTTQLFNLSLAPMQSFLRPVDGGEKGGLSRRDADGGGYYSVRPEYGGAPGNQTILNAIYPGLSVEGGKRISSAAGVSHADRRGQRLAPDKDGAPQAKVPHVLRERDVLYEVTGTTPRAVAEIADTLTGAGRTLGGLVSSTLGAIPGPVGRGFGRVGRGIATAFEKVAGLARRVHESDTVTSTVYVAATVQVRIPLSDLRSSHEVPAGRFLGSDNTTEADHRAAREVPVLPGWVALIGRGATTGAGPRVGGRTTAMIRRELDSLPADRGVALIGDDHRVAAQRLAEATGRWVLAQVRQHGDEDGKHGFQRAMSEVSGWALYHGRDVTELPDRNFADAWSRAVQIAGTVPAAAVTDDERLASGAAGPDMSDWEPVGTQRDVDLLLERFPRLRDINGPGGTTNCVLATIAAVSQMREPGRRYQALPSVATEVSLLPSWAGSPMLDVGGTATVAAALRETGATGTVIAAGGPGRQSHVFLATRVAPARAGHGPHDGVAFYDPQTGARARAPRPGPGVRLRFMGIPGTGVDTSPITGAVSAPDAGLDRQVHTLGDFTGADAQKTLHRIQHAVRGAAGGPVVAIHLGGSQEAALDAVARLDRTLRGHAWLGETPIVAATLGTRVTRDAFAEVVRAWNVPVVQEGMDVFSRVWRATWSGAEAAAPHPEMFAVAPPEPAPGLRQIRPLAEWLTRPDWAAAEAYQREHDVALRTGDVLDQLRAIVERYPDDPRLPGFLTALSMADRAGGVPETRLTPAAVSFLEVEPAYDAAVHGPAPATFVYDYLTSAGGARRDRFRMDGLLFQLMVAGQLTPGETTSLARTAAVNALDRANARIFEVVADLMLAPGARLLDDAAALLGELTARVGRVTGVRPGTLREDCLDPIDRTAWVGRLDFLRDRLRASPDPVERERAAVLDAITYTLSNC